ncbi:phospholipase A1 PLIP1, chloroplastic [Andrographis paniculata]|uniref:phospholipase A1 PLIP1, chloroplastic n=1 Tax=Andrographis paniculata TaxID=175694 RepID=UPI0021E8A2EF|nr:phospholipase A1 PLIP1, chloroplastic [Andrographis paniculata]XP_051132946.1 phospholipase A1 PLIP1, chloroplastic [Andrographis paniculata]
MASSWSQLTSPTPRAAADGELRRSLSNKDLHMHRRANMRRSYSDNHLCCASSIKAASAPPSKLKISPSVGFFNIQLSDTLKSFIFDLDQANADNSYESDLDDYETDMDEGKGRVNWMERLVELRNNWKGKQGTVEEDYGEVDGDGEGDEEGEGCGEEGGCEVEYEEDEESWDTAFNREIFSSMLRSISWSDAKIFSHLAFLCNMAYAIPALKTQDLKRYCELDYVTSSLEKKVEAAAIKERVEQGSTMTSSSEVKDPVSTAQQKPVVRSSAAYEIATSAASYVQSRAKGLISRGAEPQIQVDESTYPPRRIHKSEMAACVAASTMTAVVAAGENQKEKAAKDLQSLHSSPCEWFVCDDSRTNLRCFVIQGSDSLASWQANLLFEPTKFEGTDVLVHRGIYEAAKGIYDQFMPEIKKHLNRFGDQAKLQFTGHSLGGSLALLVNLMLLTRKVVEPSALLPVVTFGSPFIFCGGHKILDQLGLDDNHVHCVMMHRDIVPRAFSCNYPNTVTQVLKRLNGTFRSHPCLNKNKLMYSPMGKLFILQPDEKSSPPHPMLPPGRGLFALDNTNSTLTKRAIRAFLNSPHPIEILSDPTAYGSEGTIIRDHDSSNYSKAVSEVIMEQTRLVVRKTRKQRNQIWPLLTAQPRHELSYQCNIQNNKPDVTEKALAGV